MKIREFVNQNDGISPVIGVILMVAITVILAAVVAAMVFGITGSQDTAPQTTFEFEFTDNGSYDPPNVGNVYKPPLGDASVGNPYQADNLTVIHDGGQTIESTNLVVRTYGDGIKYIEPDGDLGGANYRQKWRVSEMGGPTQFSVEDSVTVTTIQQDADDDANRDVTMLDKQEVYVIYNSPSTDETITLTKWTGPKA